MSVGNLREKYRTRASECGDSRERKNHAVRRRRGDSERSGIRNRWRRTRRERTTREKIVTQRDRTRGSSGFSRDVTAPAAGGRRPASPYENTRPVLRPNWLSPGASSCSRRKRTFLGYHAVPSFFSSHPFEAGY